MGCMGKSNLNLKAVVNKRSSPSTFHFYVQEKYKKKIQESSSTSKTRLWQNKSTNAYISLA